MTETRASSEYTLSVEEIWRDIPGEPGYQASNFGRIRSVDRMMQRRCDKRPFLHRGKVLTPKDNGKGYKHVTLGMGKQYYIHRLVLSTFCPNNNPALTDVNHLDGNKGNNRLANLEWCTRTDNNYHAYNTGLHSSGERHSQSKYSNSLVASIKERHANGEKVCDLSRELGIAYQYVSGIIHGRKRVHG